MKSCHTFALALSAWLCSTAGSAAVYTQVALSGTATYSDCGLSGLDCHDFVGKVSATFNFGPDELSVIVPGGTAFLSSTDFYGGNAALSIPLVGPVGSFLFAVTFKAPIDLTVPGQSFGLGSVGAGAVQLVYGCGGRSECTTGGSLDTFSFVTSDASFGAPGLTSNVTTGFAPTAAAPEAASWMMMVMGFGAAGFALRRRPKIAVRFS